MSTNKQSELDHARYVNTLLTKGGLERHEVSPSEVQTLEPALRTDVIGGFYTESDFTGDIHSYARATAPKPAKPTVSPFAIAQL